MNNNPPWSLVTFVLAVLLGGLSVVHWSPQTQGQRIKQLQSEIVIERLEQKLHKVKLNGETECSTHCELGTQVDTWSDVIRRHVESTDGWQSGVDLRTWQGR